MSSLQLKIVVKIYKAKKIFEKSNVLSVGYFTTVLMEVYYIFISLIFN
jgi:hypothetical protein